jgi:single-strand DNA-binding protein
MNKAILFGNVGGDPDVKKIGENKVAKFSLATNKTYTKDGEKVTETAWHNILFWGKTAELCEKYVKKGSSLIVEGEIRYQSYENKDGQTVYVTEIIGNALHFAGGKKEETKPAGTQTPYKFGYSDINDLPGHVQEQQSASESDEGPY